MQDKTKVLQRELDELRTQIAALEMALEDKPTTVWARDPQR